MLGAVEEACLRWKAVQNERQLVEGMNREGSVAGPGGAAATSSGELAPEREVAGVHTAAAAAVRLKEEKQAGAVVDGAAAPAPAAEEDEEEEEEEEYVFQFGTVNMSDEEAAGDEAGLDAAPPAGAEARDSPENLRYHDSGVVEDQGDGTAATAAAAAAAVAQEAPRPNGDEFSAASLPAVAEEAARFAGGDGSNANTGGGGTGGSDGADGGYDKENADGPSLLTRQPLQTEQLRDGVFFPTHSPPPPPPPQQLQQSQDARMAPSFQHHGQGGVGPMQHQQQHPLPHHQRQQMPPPQQQQPQPQRGASGRRWRWRQGGRWLALPE
eukprot:g16182.t1